MRELDQAPAAEAGPGPAGGDGRAAARTLRRLAAASTFWLLLALAFIFGAFALLRFDQFTSAFNLRNIGIDASVLLIIAVGMTFVIITAGIDLSVGAVLVFASVISAMTMRAIGGDGLGTILGGFGAALAAGAAWGLVNGALVAKARIPALIVTLGTLGMAQGSALLLTGGINIRSVPATLVSSVGIGRLAGTVPYLVLIAAAVALLGAFALHGTVFGRHTYAIGSNEEAARRAGVNVDRHLIKIYTLSGALSGLAGFLTLARFTTTTIQGHATENLQAIAAVVIGGTSLFGGVGTIFGTLIGVFIPATLRNGFIILGLQPFWQQVAVGAVLIAAVYIDQFKRKARERRI